MQPGYELAKQAGTSVDEIAQAATLASDDVLLDVYEAVRKFQGQTTNAAQQTQVAEVLNVMGKEIERRNIAPPALTAAKTAADDFNGTSLLHALWLKFKEWLLTHNGYADYYDGAFASLKRQAADPRSLKPGTSVTDGERTGTIVESAPKAGFPTDAFRVKWSDGSTTTIGSDLISLAKESTVNPDQTFAQREAALLQAMASAPTLERQRELAHDLVTLRHERTASVQAERDLDLANAVVRDTMTPVVTASRHTIATDWMGEDAAVEGDEITRTMAAAASRFFLATSSDVKADAEEFEIQATGMANAVAGQYGEQAPVAVDAFVRHAIFLNRGGVVGEAKAASLGSNPNVTPLVTKVAEGQSYADWLAEQPADAHHPEGQDVSAWAQSSPQAADSAEVEKEGAKTAADADINPYPANEQAGYAETGLPPTVPTEGYEEKGVVGDYGQEVAPENVAAVEEEGERTPMPGAGESVPGVTTQSATRQCANCRRGNHSGTNGTPGCSGGSCPCPCRTAKARSAVMKAQGAVKVASNPVKGIAIYPDKRVEDVTINGLSDGQAIVGGLIQPVTLKDGSTMYVNEEFLYSFGPDDVNWIASDVAGLGGRPEFMLRSPILGPVYIVGPVDGEGYDTDITDTARNWVTRVKREASIKPVASALDAGMRSPTQGFATSILAQGGQPAEVTKTAADGHRPIYEIASEIRSDWKNVYFGAVPYLDAMGGLDSINDRYGADDARMILNYFLSNASTWRGETAKRVKAEIKAMLGRKASMEHTAAYPCTYCAGTGTVSNGAPGMDLGPGFPEFLECPMCHGTKEVSSKGKQKKPYTMHGSKTAGTDPDDQSGEAQSNLPTPEKDTTVAWPWELPEGDVKNGEGAANVAGVPTPGGEEGYPQPKKATVDNPDGYVHAFRTFLGMPAVKGEDEPVCGAKITDAYESGGSDRPRCPDCERIMASSKQSVLVADPQRLAAFQAAVQTK